MDTKEQEVAIGELEERVDRLRVLYEQYFLGFEKLEPMVPRKDVDRRFAVLRKEQIRNTALRFKFNVVTQKYNTYSMYWVRICRQIEEGTYKRDVRRAKQRFGEDAPSADASVEVDLTDFELDGDDLDAVLAEADAAAVAYERAALDTVPPAVTRSLQPAQHPASVVIQNPRGVVERAPAPAQTPAAATRVARPYTPAAPLAGQPARVPAPAALPPGAKPRVVVRRAGEAPPPNQAPARAPAPAPAPPTSSAASTGRYPVAQQYASDPLIDATPMTAPSPPARAPNLSPARQPGPTPSSAARVPVAPVARPVPISPPRQADGQGVPPRGAPIPEGQRPQIRPRAPLPLPSQGQRPKKDE
ncbi:hypothetical protein [Labilithrix luteola]|uniref:hypothetical protein n=1 Tax=Labilithrix luteola TaxID=1391654 RepID=UPI0011BAB05E|nr:hypothetical protein [Labilithrix luteola]